jgi:hypothetical protein
MSRLVVVFLALSGVAFAQGSAQIDFGVRGGLLFNNSFQENQLCSGAGCVFGTRSFNADALHGTLGPTIGALLYNRVEVRFEAVHRNVGYQVRSDLVGFGAPVNSSHSLESVHGNFWEYPLLATYHFGSGRTRVYAGGGLALGTSGKITSDTQIMQTSQTATGPVTTTPFFSQTYSLPSSSVYYLNGGIDARIPHFSIRPEFRYSRFPGGSDSSAEAILKPNQFEFVLGFVVHPFHAEK